jgi:superfamily II DNA or RNA helicase
MELSRCYIGQKGFTIPKKDLSPEALENIRTELVLSPKESFGIKKASKQDAIKIPVYRENAEKLYIPRFFGVEKFGEPPATKLSPGDSIDVPFVNQLRDYQEKIVKIYTDHVSQSPQGGGGILEVPCGRGKCLGKDTPILMYDGTIKLVQDVVQGDQIMGDDSKPRNVLSLARGRETMYKVCSKKHQGYVVNESHILSLKYSTNLNKNTKKGDKIDICVKDFLKLPKYYHGRGGPLVGYRVPIDFPQQTNSLPINPYLVGLWLGDGHSNSSDISIQDAHVQAYIRVLFQEVHPSLHLHNGRSQYDYRVNSHTPKNIFRTFLREYTMLQNKHIPHIYKTASKEDRYALLAGIIDSDGHYRDNCYEIIQRSELLLDDIIFVARSLGFAAFKTKCTKTCTNGKHGPVTGTYYRTNIYGKNLENIPVCCLRKKAHPRKLLRDPLNYRIKLQRLEEDEYYGFEIDGNHRFVLGDFTVTHNTIMSLNIIHRMQKKTFILVHKEFLMNQWIDRIRDFLPSARVGIVQASTFDINNKDIVIGMIQTIYNRDYKPDTFSSFGLTIIDEVHRIGSEEFSKTLTKIVTPYMLGISATVDRKDGLTDILYMFIGPKIYHEERKEADVVQVRGIQYEDPNDIEFNTVEYDFRGNVKYSTMVSRISDHLPRCRFLVRVIQDLMVENDENQIMILSHKRDLLVYIHDEIVRQQIGSCGYYVGGMKQKNLQETETKQIVLATYAMAAEALDIKTLNTLVMVSPKTDIVQSVGRILRTHGNGKIIVDVIDPHEVFQNQWKKRKTFYNKSGYITRVVKSQDYNGMRVDWENDTKWKLVTTRKRKGGSGLGGEDGNEVPKCMIQLQTL